MNLYNIPILEWLALLGWWINAWFFIASSSVIVWVLYRREFRSKSLVVANRIRELAEPTQDSEVPLPDADETFRDRRFLQITPNADII